jgi:hypothetical protein
LNARDRHELRQVKALVMAGDRAGALARLRALTAEPRRDVFGEGGQQLVLAFVVFRCEKLAGEEVAAHVCVTRQKITDVQRTQQTSRGQGTDHPLCDSRSCAQGRRIRAALDPAGKVSWRGEGPRGRFARERPKEEKEQQRAKASQLRAIGLGLRDEVPTLDGEPRAVESDGEGGLVDP